MKRIKSIEEAEKQSKFYAAHYFDFDKRVHFGSIPLVNASYFEKNSGILFSDVNAFVILEGQKVHMAEWNQRILEATEIVHIQVIHFESFH